VAFVFSVVAFAGYTFPLGTKVKTRQIDSPIDEVPLLGRDGTYAPSAFSGPAAVVLSIDLGGGGDASPFTGVQMWSLDDLNDECNRIYQQLAGGYNLLTIGNSGNRGLVCQKQKFMVTYGEGTGRTHGTLDITFYAQDPRWLGTTRTATLTGGASHAALNEGTLPAYPTITLTGPSTGPVGIEGAPGGGTTGDITVQTTYTLLSGDTMIITTDPRSRDQAILLEVSGGVDFVARNDLIAVGGITNTVGDDSTFPYIAGGFQGASNAPGSLKTLGAPATSVATWNDAWAL
jgi:hypothetical protein